MNVTWAEIASQPEKWRHAVQRLPAVRAQLPSAGQRVAVIGCGTSYFIAQAVASLRESSSPGATPSSGQAWPACVIVLMQLGSWSAASAAQTC